MTPLTGEHTAHELQRLDDLLREQVAVVLAEQLGAGRAQLRDIAPEAVTLVDSLERYLAGGKLLRPRFCFWGGLSALEDEPTAQQVEALARCGAAIELVQAAALMHDDVIDHSPTRRGRPAMHVEAMTAHREQHLAGSPEDYGTAVAVVLGDLALSWAEQVFARIPAAGERGVRARAEFDALRTEVMTGQFLDVLHQAGGFTSPAGGEEAALSVIRWKTVPYTVLRPVRLGAALMGAEDGALDLMGDWAIEVGTGFQLLDDLLSVIGDEDSTGKPTGGDILEGKRTVLLARTEAAADGTGRDLLSRTVGSAAAPRGDVLAVHDLMVSTGAVASVAEDVRAHAARATAVLSRADGPGALGRAGLARLAALATDVDALPA